MVELVRKIRKKYQREIGLAQDLIIEMLYRFFPKAVLHGGTFIWRCFNGNRFSEDIDVFLPRKEEKKIEEFFRELKKIGFEIEKLRVKETSVFSKLSHGRALVRVEVVFKRVDGELFDYECLDGRKIPVLGLPVKVLIREKIDAFLERKKVRDLYDVYFLLKFVERDEEVEEMIGKLIEKFEKPKDEDELEKVIIFGYAPKSTEILDYLKRWMK